MGLGSDSSVCRGMRVCSQTVVVWGYGREGAGVGGVSKRGGGVAVGSVNTGDKRAVRPLPVQIGR